jgi:hypothetical protein
VGSPATRVPPLILTPLVPAPRGARTGRGSTGSPWPT